MTDQSPPAYVISTDDNWVRGMRFAIQLLRGGTRVLLVSESAQHPPGTLIVPCSTSFDPWAPATGADAILAAAKKARVELLPLGQKEGVVASPLAVVRVGLYGGGGAPFNQAAILAECGFPIRFLSDADILAGGLGAVDVLIVPGGGFRAMNGQIEPLGEAGCRAIADFVRRGGTYIGCCAGSYDCAVLPESFLQSCPAQRHLQLINARAWQHDDEDEPFDLKSPGVGVVTVRNERPDHPVMYGLPARFNLVHYNGPIFDPLAESHIEGASEAVGLAAFSGWTERFTPAERFALPPLDPESTLLERAIAAGRYSAVAGYYGLGRVVAFGSHPEFGFDLPMIEWTAPARMLVNAVLWQAASGRVSTDESASVQADRRVGLPLGRSLSDVLLASEIVKERAGALQERSIEPRPEWLTSDYALSVFGMPPDEVWRQSLDAIQTLANDAAELASKIQLRFQQLQATRRTDLLPTLLLLERWIRDERPAEWRQDGGYHGSLTLLRVAAEMCKTALESWQIELGPPAGAYAYLHTNPYHLVAGSYLAAVGCVGGAVLLLRAISAELEMTELLADVRPP